MPVGNPELEEIGVGRRRDAGVFEELARRLVGEAGGSQRSRSDRPYSREPCLRLRDAIGRLGDVRVLRPGERARKILVAEQNVGRRLVEAYLSK